MTVAMTIAGSDPSGGAGLQADQQFPAKGESCHFRGEGFGESSFWFFNIAI